MFKVRKSIIAEHQIFCTTTGVKSKSTVAAVASVILGVVLFRYTELNRGVHDTTAVYGSMAAGIFLALSGIYSALSGWKHKVILTENRIIDNGVFYKKELLFTDIEFYRLELQTTGQYLYLAHREKRFRSIYVALHKLSNADKLYEWCKEHLPASPVS